MKTYPQHHIVAYTRFDEHEYCALVSDLVGKDVYVIDPPGVEFFLTHARKHHFRRPFQVVYVYCPWYRRLYRMINRDGLKKALTRMWNDFRVFRNFEYDIKLRN